MLQASGAAISGCEVSFTPSPTSMTIMLNFLSAMKSSVRSKTSMSMLLFGDQGSWWLQGILTVY